MEIPKLPLAVVNVVVALPVPKKKSPPESEISPDTSSLVEGDVLPMPTLPEVSIVMPLIELAPVVIWIATPLPSINNELIKLPVIVPSLQSALGFPTNPIFEPFVNDDPPS